MNLTCFARPQLRVEANTLQQLALHHVETKVEKSSSRAQCVAGFTVWGQGRIQIAWDWCKTPDQIVVLLAPMSIMINADLVDSTGAAITELEAIGILNAKVSRLPWVEVALEACTGRQSGPNAMPRLRSGQR